MSVAETPTNEIEINNVGPIQNLTIPIPPGGGVVVLHGENGSGKTTAINSVESLYSNETRRTLRNSDGTQKGTVSGLGIKVRLGRKNTASGELLCESIDGKVDPSTLVDPGIKDPVKADSKRLATLIRLGSVEVSADKWVEAMGPVVDEIAIDDLVSPDPVVAADRIRRALHEVAKQREQLAQSKAFESASISKEVADVDVSAESDEETLAAKMDEANTEYLTMLGRKQQGDQSKLAFLEAKEKLASAIGGGVDIVALRDELEAYQKDRAETGEVILGLRDRIKKLQADMAEAVNASDKIEVKILDLENRISDAEKSSAYLIELRQTVDAGIPDTIDDGIIDVLRSTKEKAVAAVQRGEVVRRAKATLAKSETLENESKEIAERAVTLRSYARSTDSVLEQALIDAGFNRIKVDDGRLCVESDRGLEPFSELSHGERWTIALDLAAAGLPAGSVLPVCQEAFESLDPSNREFIAGLAKERGIVIVTALATGGALRAEVMEGGAV